MPICHEIVEKLLNGSAYLESPMSSTCDHPHHYHHHHRHKMEKYVRNKRCTVIPSSALSAFVYQSISASLSLSLLSLSPLLSLSLSLSCLSTSPTCKQKVMGGLRLASRDGDDGEGDGSATRRWNCSIISFIHSSRRQSVSRSLLYGLCCA